MYIQVTSHDATNSPPTIQVLGAAASGQANAEDGSNRSNARGRAGNKNAR